MISIRPISNAIQARLHTARTVAEAAVETVVLAPEERHESAAAISLADQIGRVRRVQEETSIEAETRRVLGGLVVNSPTKAFRLKDVHYTHGVAYASGMSRRQMPGGNPFVGLIRCKLDRASLTSSYVGSRYFGHHVVDDAARTLMATDFAPAFRAPASAVANWPHASVYRERMGVDVPPLVSARIDEAWIFDDRGMTWHRKERLEELRFRLRDRPGARSGHGVFIRRRGGGIARVLENEQEIEDLLKAEGFDIIDLVTDPAEDVIARCRDASIICGVEGSGLAHGLLGAAPGAAFVVLQHPWRFNNIWKDFTDLLGMRYAYVVGEGSPRSFRMRPDDIRATLDLL